MMTIRLTSILLAALLTGCAGVSRAPRDEAPSAIDPHHLYRTAFVHYANLPRLRYFAGMRSGPVAFGVLDTVLPGNPRPGRRYVDEPDTAGCVSCHIQAYRDSTLSLLATGTEPPHTVVFMPIDSLTDSSRYFVGFRIYPDPLGRGQMEGALEYLKEYLAEVGEQPEEFGVAIDRAGRVTGTYGHSSCTFDVALGPNHLDLYRRALAHLATNARIKVAFRSHADSMPLRVLSLLVSELPSDMLPDFVDDGEWRRFANTRHPGYPTLDTALLGEIQPSCCRDIRDTTLYLLSAGTDTERVPLVKFSRPDLDGAMGYRVITAYIYPAGAKEETLDSGWGIQWDWLEVMIFDREGNLILSSGNEPGCRHP